MLSGIAGRIKASLAFVLDPNATAMGVGVFLSRPSSMLAALPFLRLPSDSVWIEFSNLATRAELARLGNANEWLEGGVLIEKTGFVVTRDGDRLVLEAVAQYRSDGGPSVELFTAECAFDLSPEFERQGIDPAKAMFPSAHSTGKAAKFRRMLLRERDELAAMAELNARFSGRAHPDCAALVSGPGSFLPRGMLESSLEGHIEDMRRFFMMQVLPVIILLNCRNAVEIEHVERQEKLNRARRKKGKPEIGEYRYVRLHLSPRKRRVYEARGESRGQVEGGLVMGHFKVRRSGVYWWSPHWRGTGAPDSPRPVRILTR